MFNLKANYLGSRGGFVQFFWNFWFNIHKEIISQSLLLILIFKFPVLCQKPLTFNHSRKFTIAVVYSIQTLIVLRSFLQWDACFVFLFIESFPSHVWFLEVNHSFWDANSSFYLRYLTLVPATLIIYARPLFNVINVSACSTNTDNFLSLRSPQHLHPKAGDSYRADPIPFLARGCGPVISFANVFSL